MDFSKLFTLTLAANYMQNNSLMDGCATAIAMKIEGMTRDELRQFFNIPEEE